MKRAAGLAVSLCMFLTAALCLAACGISETQTQESTADARETESTVDSMAEPQTEQESAQEILAETETIIMTACQSLNMTE